MKKIFTIAFALMATLSLMAADKFYALNDMTVVGNTYTSATFSGEKAKSNNIYIELPSASVSGTIAFWGQSDKTDRFLYIYGTNGTVKDETRPITMLAAGDTINYTAADVITIEDTPYLLFSTPDDFKFTKFEYTAEGAAPVTNPVTTVTISGATEGFVGQSVSLKATFDVAPDTIYWTVDGAVQDVHSNTFVLELTAERTYQVACWARNQYNAADAWVLGNHNVVATIKPAAVPCANIIPASSGTAPTEVGTEIDLDVNSEGGQMFVAGMKTPGESIVYSQNGLGFMKGGADSVRVEFSNLIAEGTIIKLVIMANGTGSRGLKIQTVGRSNVFDASWSASAAGEVREFEYTVPAGSALIGDYRILLQRNNSVYLQSVQMGDCGEARDLPVDTDPALNVDKESLTFEATAANPNPSATVKFTGKNLTPGTYNLTTPGAGSWTVNPTQVTVGENGKLSADITISYALNEYVESETSSISLTINNITKTVALSATSEASINYISASVNIEGQVVANGKGYNIQAAFDAANIEYSDIDGLDSLNNSKGANRNEEYLGLKIKKAGGYLAGWLQAGHTIRVKFGEVKDDMKVNGMTISKATLKAAPLEYTALEDTYVKIETTTSNTVVIKQIMLDAPIVDVMYKITYAASDHGTTSGWTIAFPNEEVFLTFSPEESYIVMHCDYNGTEIVGQPNVQESFTMPAAPVTVTTVYDLPNAIDNTDDAVKTAKFFQNGQLFIEKNGVLYNAQGAIVK